jgi:hypothetical protein
MVDKEGWVYVLTNDAMPELVKIGYTMNDPAIRAEELSSDTGVPLPFVVAYKALVVNPKQIEQEVHGKLDSKRLNDKREFFKCEPFEAIRYIRDTTTIKYEESKEDVDRRIQQQKELEEQDRIRRQEELEEQRRIKQRKELEEQDRARRQKEMEWNKSLLSDIIDYGEPGENLFQRAKRYTEGFIKIIFGIAALFMFFFFGAIVVSFVFGIIGEFL